MRNRVVPLGILRLRDLVVGYQGWDRIYGLAGRLRTELSVKSDLKYHFAFDFCEVHQLFKTRLILKCGKNR